MRMGFGFGMDMGAAGPSPSFSANFLAGTLPPGLTYTNSSVTRTYFGADGLLKTAVANEPIFEYDPVTLALLGMRWEMEQRTNLLLWSGDVTKSSWLGVGLTKTGGQADSRGGNAAVLLTGPSATPPTHQVVASASGTHSFKIVAKGVSGTTSVQLLIRNATTAVNDVVATVNPITGQIISGAGWTSRQLANGFYEYKFTTTIAITAGNLLACYFGASGAVASGWNLIVDYAQLEAGASASSYIPTTTAAVTRQPDVLTATSLSPWYNQSEGTVVFEGIASLFSAVNGGIFVFNDGTNNERVTSWLTAVGTQTMLVVDGGANMVNMTTANAATVSSIFRSATSYKIDDFASAINGGTAVTDNAGTLPAITQLKLGAARLPNLLPFMGYARRFSYYPRRLPDAQIQGMSRV